MMSAQNSNPAWLLFCVQNPFLNQAHLYFICGTLHFESTVRIKCERTYDINCEGDLFGKRYELEISSRKRLPGDLKDASIIQFVGKFEHEDGPSGDFTIRSRDGELM